MLIADSQLPALSQEPYPFRDLHAPIRRLVDAYECIHLFTNHLPWLSGEDQEWVLGRGVCVWLGWPVDAK